MLIHDGRQLLNIQEAAERMRVNRITIRRWLDAGQLEHMRTPVGRRLIFADALLRPATPEPDQAA